MIEDVSYAVIYYSIDEALVFRVGPLTFCFFAHGPIVSMVRRSNLESKGDSRANCPLLHMC